MYKLKTNVLFALLGSALILASCTKTDSTEDIIGNWVKRSDFEGVARSEAVSFVINNKAYLGTGYDGTDRLKDMWEYDPVQNFWVQKADMPVAGRSSAVGFAVGDKGYVGTGYDGVDDRKDFWQYNPAANAWVRKADFGGSARYDAVGFGLLGKGYITTGYDGNYLKDLWEYDAATDKWTQRASMGGTKRSGATVFVYNNKAYVCTGSNNGSTSTVNDLWVFDPTAATAWTEKRKISNVSSEDFDDDYNVVRANAVSFVMNNKAYISCGDGGGVYKSTWQYDFTTDLWEQKTDYEGTARTGAIGFTLSNRGYVLTGRSSNTPFDDVREFFPDNEYDEND
jgi:N-acetylneuraminic acid mutarotase